VSMNLQEHIRRVIREETHKSTYVIRRSLCFNKFIDELENDESDVPVIRNHRVDWNHYQIILTAYMRADCEDTDNFYHDEKLHNEIMSFYGDRLYEWFKNKIMN